MKKLLLIASTLAVMIAIFSFSSTAYAADDPLKDVCNGAGAQAAVCQSRTTENPLFGQKGVLTKVVQIIVMATAVVAVIMIMVGGFRYIISNGDAASVNSAKNTILYAIIGLAVAVLGQTIVSFVLQKL